MKNQNIVLVLIMIQIVFISFSMEQEEMLVVEGAAYCSLEFPDAKKVRIFRAPDGSLVRASEESVAELFQKKLSVVVRLKSKNRKTLNKFSTSIEDIEAANALKNKIGIMLDSEAEVPEFLSSSEQLVEKNAVISRGCISS